MSGLLRTIIKRPHPILVHFPITLFPVSLLFLVLFWLLKNPVMLLASYWVFLIAVLFVIPTALTGWADMKRLIRVTESAKLPLSKHLINGIAITAISILTGIFFLFQSPFETRGVFALYAVDLLALSFLAVWQSYLGGRMVYAYRLGIDGETR